nr:GntR family transcriptional regulator [Cupriavidus basilensis]
MRKLETAMLDGTWPAGARLPAERLLAGQYGVARNTVREATQRLAARGLLQSRQGAGVFVTEQLRTGFASPWRQLVADHPVLRDDILEFRRVLEGATAYFAAMRADAAFLHLHTSVIGMLREHITINGTGLRVQDEDASALLLLQHRTLCEAICARRPEEARTAMQTHIDFVRSRVEQPGEGASA